MATMRAAIGARLGSVIVQLLPSAATVITQVATTLSFGPIMVFPSQVPATSDALRPAAGAGAAGAAGAAGFWALATAACATSATKQSSMRRRMGGPPEKAMAVNVAAVPARARRSGTGGSPKRRGAKLQGRGGAAKKKGGAN